MNAITPIDDVNIFHAKAHKYRKGRKGNAEAAKKNRESAVVNALLTTDHSQLTFATEKLIHDYRLTIHVKKSRTA